MDGGRRAVVALSEAGAALGRPDWVGAAAEAAELLLRLHVVDDRLRRSSRDGAVGGAAGVLEDHAHLAEAALALHQATGEARWLGEAVDLLDLALARFADSARPGTFYDTADDAEALLHRPRDLTDNASPCGSSALTGALVTASVLVEAERAGSYRDAAAMRAVGTLAEKYPRFAGHWLTAAEAAVRGPLQVAVVGAEQDRCWPVTRWSTMPPRAKRAGDSFATAPPPQWRSWPRPNAVDPRGARFSARSKFRVGGRFGGQRRECFRNGPSRRQ